MIYEHIKALGLKANHPRPFVRDTKRSGPKYISSDMHPIAVAAALLGMNLATIEYRLNQGMSLEEAFRPPITSLPKPDPRSLRSRCKAAGVNYGEACRARRNGQTRYKNVELSPH